MARSARRALHKVHAREPRDDPYSAYAFMQITDTLFSVERDTIFVVSDVHIGSKHFSHEKQKSKFWDFLEEVGNNASARELILNGDIIETWASPIEEVYSIEQIFQHEDVVTFSHFIRFVVEKGVEVVYIIGNHDSRVTEASIQALLGTDVKVLYTYVKYGIHFSHGHRYDYFNSTDPVGTESLPIGYYATRVDYNHEIGFSHERRDNLRNTMHKVLPDLTKSRAIVSEKIIISTFMTHMWIKSRPLVSLWKTGSMPRIVNEKNEPETMSMISNRLYPLYQAWAASNTDDYVAATMRCSMTAEYSWFIESGQYGQVSHVVHGHTHNGLVQTYPTAWGEITYVNNGAWEYDRMNYAKFVLTPQLTVDSCELVTMYNN